MKKIKIEIELPDEVDSNLYVQNITKFGPILATDKDWDADHLLKVIALKLSCMRDFFESDKAYNARSDEIVSEISQALEIIQNLLSGYYEDVNMLPYYNKYPMTEELFVPMDWEKKLFYAECTDNWNE